MKKVSEFLKKASWKTTLFGALTVAGFELSKIPGTIGTIGSVVTAIAPAVGLFFAKDNDKRSEKIKADNNSV